MTTTTRPEVELVVLATDHEQTLAATFARLRSRLDRLGLAPGSWRVTLADHGSTDGTARVARELAATHADVHFVRFPSRLDRAELRAHWADSTARTVAFVDLTPDADVDFLLAPVVEHASGGRPATTGTEAVEHHTFDGLLNRRAALATFGGLGLTALVAACSGSSSASKPAPTSSNKPAQSPSTTSAPSPVTTALHPVVLAPEIIEGPYYLNVKEVRSNITEDRRGAPLALNLVVADAASGAPLKGAAVEIWHADADGLYSGFVKTSANVNKATTTSSDDGTFLRGTQLTGSDGRVMFTTIYPGWYSGRAVHIHVKVHAKGSVIHTGQLYFDDALTDKVFGSVAPYSARAERDVRNATDGFYGAPGRLSTLAVQKRSDGYRTTMTIGVKSV